MNRSRVEQRQNGPGCLGPDLSQQPRPCMVPDRNTRVIWHVASPLVRFRLVLAHGCLAIANRSLTGGEDAVSTPAPVAGLPWATPQPRRRDRDPR
jgi:hypothetical protein